MRSATKFLSLVVLGFAILTGGLASPANAGEVPRPNPAKAFKGTECVEPVDVMRREHMNFLKHQRDETLREGIRGQKYSLNQCIDCHAVTSPDIMGGKVRTLKPFCAECHNYAAVSIDCFQCHTGAAVPGIGQTTSPLPNGHPAVAVPATEGGTAQ
ncbi:MAG: Hdr-like menaquinol oxidoreductase cytochrome c subunit [Rhodospirillales bacterium]|nr:Hdr-like menaquinol oxidoreductase cytochrome c subunit [Rhodospirillales bacterium]